MKRIQRCSVNHWAVGRLSFRSPKPHRQHVRKRRFPLPRQARGRDLDAIISYGTKTLVFPATTPQLEPEVSKLQYRLQSVLWACVVILGLIVFSHWLARFIREAPFAWPSINGGF